MATKPRHRKTLTQLWVYDNAKRLGLKDSDLAAATGVEKDTARAWFSRGKPNADAIVALERLFGRPAPDEETGPSTMGEAGLGALVEALHAQTLAINALVTELREDRRLGSEVRERVAESAAFLVERELRRQAGRPQGDETPEDEQSGSAPLPAAR